MRRTFAIIPALALLAACDGGGGGTGPDPLTPQQVAGVYALCTLSFHPSNGALPAADLLTSVVDTTPPAGRPQPTIALATNRTYDLAYTNQASAFLEQIRGSITYGENRITLSLPTDDRNAASLLMPRNLLLNYDAAAGRLSGDASGYPYPVARADYATAAGISQEGLQSTINGTLSVSFAQNGC